MKRVLITGASGFVGRALCESLIGQFTVRAQSRSWKRDLSPKIEQVVVSDIHGQTDWSEAIDGVDVVVHLAGLIPVMKPGVPEPPSEAFFRINQEGTRCLAEAARAAGIERLIYLSSSGVHGYETDGTPWREDSPIRPYNDYTRSKWEAEKQIRAICEGSSLQYVMIRPCRIYGAEADGPLRTLLDAVSKRFPFPLGSVRNQRSMLYVGNLIDLISTCLISSRAANQTFLASDGEAISTPDLIRVLSEARGIRPILFSFPIPILRFILRMIGAQDRLHHLIRSIEVDPSFVSQQLQWAPPVSLFEGLRLMAQKAPPQEPIVEKILQ